MRKSYSIIGMMLLAMSILLACQGQNQGQKTEETSDDTVSVQPKGELSSIFGEIPVIFENEMKLITKEAEKQSKDSSIEAIRSIMAVLADSAYHEAEKKAAPSAVEMMGASIKHSSEDGLGYELTSKIEVISAIMPELTSVGGEEKVVVQFSVKKDLQTQEAFYALIGADGEVGVGKIVLPPQDGDVQVVGQIHAPNIPSKYLQSCGELRFISKKTYDTLKPQIAKRQEKWRNDYSKEIGLSK